MKIRRAEIGDIDALADIDAQSLNLPWSREAFENEISRNKAAFYAVCEVRGTVAGYMGMWLIADEGHITNVAVHPDYRRKGIGGAILARVLEYMEEEGISDFTLEVRESNDPAIRLYERYGFKEEGTRPGYYRDNGESAVIMWRRKDEK